MNNMKRNACQKCVFAVRDDNPHCGLRGFRSDFNVEWCESENDKVPNGYELQEDGYFSWVEKKKEYPKTYEECCEVLGIEGNSLLINTKHITDYERDLGNLMGQLHRLIICRDAYWKIAGGEMGFGKPWEPDYTEKTVKYCLRTNNCRIVQTRTSHDNHPFSFPTEEMRDAFYENFKEEIEICKELL